MAEYNILQTLTYEAEADLSGAQYCAVRLSNQYKINLATDLGATPVVGILLNKPQNTQFGAVAWSGKCKVVAGGAITVGATVGANSSGRAVAVTSGTAAFGRCLEAAAADGNIVSVLVNIAPAARAF